MSFGWPVSLWIQGSKWGTGVTFFNNSEKCNPKYLEKYLIISLEILGLKNRWIMNESCREI